MSAARPARFDGLCVLTLESRRTQELARLIATYGGRPMAAPALREIPLASNVEALDFVAALLLDEYDVVVFLTGVGTRELMSIADRVCPREDFVAALARTKVAARGPKPAAVLREMQVPAWIVAPEPNTWRELVAAMDARRDERPLRGARVAVQEYGVRNDDLIEALRERGATVTSFPVYRWTLPEDIGPLEDAVAAIARGAVDVLLLTSGVQLLHLSQVAAMLQREAELRQGLLATVIASIGPTTSEEIRRHGLEVDLEASHPKLGFLVKDAAEQAAALRDSKRARSAL